MDITFIIFIYFMPAISHMVAFPMYLFDPMRISVLGSYLLLRNRNNAVFLALSLPLVSFLFSGHPVAFKNMIIAIELVVNVLLIDVLLKSRMKTFYAVFLSIAFSKAVYYLLKISFVYIGLLNTGIVDTNILVQLVVSVFISFVFTKYYARNNEVVR